MSTISCKNMTKKYGNLQVVHGLNMEVQDKEFVVFLGPSGCGKSTIMRMIAGLEEITSGELFIGGDNVTETPAGERGVAMVFQNYALYPHMTVYKNIAFGLRRLNLTKAEIEKRVQDVVEMLQLEPYLKRKPDQMSGGQQQRVAIARAIVKTPKLFLFDEPLSNLDAKLRHQLRQEIAKLHRKLKTTTIFVTHDQLEAMTLADRIVLMNDGNIEQIGSPKEIYNKPRTRFVADFIGSPSMNFISGSARIEKGKLYLDTPIGELKFAAKLFDDIMADEVSMGVRPQDLVIGKGKAGSHSLAGEIMFIEYLGNDTMLTVDCDGVELSVVVSNSEIVAEGDTINLNFDANNIHLFSDQTGLRLNKD